MKTIKTNFIRKVFLYGSLFLTLFLAAGCVQQTSSEPTLINIYNGDRNDPPYSQTINLVEVWDEQYNIIVTTKQGPIGYGNTASITADPGIYYVIITATNGNGDYSEYLSLPFNLSNGETRRITFTGFDLRTD